MDEITTCQRCRQPLDPKNHLIVQVRDGELEDVHICITCSGQFRAYMRRRFDTPDARNAAIVEFLSDATIHTKFEHAVLRRGRWL